MVFNSEVRLETSSSPARLSSALHSEHDIDNNGEGSSKGINSNRRNMMVIDDSDASEDEEGANLRQGNPSIHRPQAGVENEAILTESESDEENTRPAQRAQPRRRTGDARDATPPLRQSTIVSASTNNANSNQVQISENETLGEARATIAKKNLQITELKNELSLKSEELELSKQTNNNLIQELQVIEARLREKNLEISNEKEQINKLKEEKKGLSKTLRSEVERVGNLNSSNRKLLDEITLLKQ